MARLTPSEARRRIRRAASDVWGHLAYDGAVVPGSVRVVIDCPKILKDRMTDPRAFMHVGHRGMWTICASLEAGRLSDPHLYGLILHEFGHPLAWRWWGKSRQQDADRIIWNLTGIPILYKSSLVLQWITPDDVRRIRTLRL